MLKMMKATIKDVADYLHHVGLQYVATIGFDGKPKVRPMQFMVLEKNKLWFCTNSRKAVYAELQQCPSRVGHMADTWQTHS